MTAHIALSPSFQLLAKPRSPGKRSNDHDGDERDITPGLQLPKGGCSQKTVNAKHSLGPFDNVREACHGEKQPAKEEEYDAPNVRDEGW